MERAIMIISFAVFATWGLHDIVMKILRGYLIYKGLYFEAWTKLTVRHGHAGKTITSHGHMSRTDNPNFILVNLALNIRATSSMTERLVQMLGSQAAQEAISRILKSANMTDLQVRVLSPEEVVKPEEVKPEETKIRKV